MTSLRGSECAVLALVLALGGCGGPTGPFDGGAEDAGSAVPVDDAGMPDGSALDAGALDASPDGGPRGCANGVIEVANDSDGARGLGLAPLGGGWAVLVLVDDAYALIRLDASGARLGDPIPLEMPEVPWIGPGAIGARALGDGVLVRSGTGLRFFRADGSEPFAALIDLAPVVLGPSAGDEVIGISGDDVIRVRAGASELVVERFAIGLDLEGFEEPTGGYVTPSTMGVSADGCVVLARTGFDYDEPSTLQTIPVIPGAGCGDVTYPRIGIGSFGVFDSLHDGRFVTIAGVFPDAEISRSHIARFETLGGATVLEGGTFGEPLSYGVRAAIASAPDRTILATAHASSYGSSEVFLWRATGTTPTLVTTDGQSEWTSVYLAWHPTLDRIAALYGTDSAGHSFEEQTLGLRCDL